jgi:hypothetical protein
MRAQGRAKARDKSIFRMLESERDRCAKVIEKISVEVERLPRGSLRYRKVKSAGKEYIYQCLKYRDGLHVKFEHVSAKRVEELRPALERRKKLLSDQKLNRKRMLTINIILKKEKV